MRHSVILIWIKGTAELNWSDSFVRNYDLIICDFIWKVRPIYSYIIFCWSICNLDTMEMALHSPRLSWKIYHFHQKRHKKMFKEYKWKKNTKICHGHAQDRNKNKKITIDILWIAVIWIKMQSLWHEEIFVKKWSFQSALIIINFIYCIECFYLQFSGTMPNNSTYIRKE